MLVIDALLTVATWLPYNLCLAVTASYGVEIYKMYTLRTLLTVDAVLKGVMFTNAFSTPVVYFIFNKHFRVSMFSTKITHRRQKSFVFASVYPGQC